MQPRRTEDRNITQMPTGANSLPLDVSRGHGKNRGLSLVWMVTIVLIVVGLLSAAGVVLVIGLAKGQMNTTKSEAAVAQAKVIENAAKRFSLNNERFPDSVDELTRADENNGDKPYLSVHQVLDPWGQRYQIDPSGQRSGSDVDVFTIDPSSGKVYGNWRP